MNWNKNIDAIIFDLDGTLWDAAESICRIWNMILVKHPSVKRDAITLNELSDCMGLPMYEIAARLFAQEEASKQRSLMDEMCAVENQYLAQHGGRLYEGLQQVLEVLKRAYPLYIVSNCQSGYIESFMKAHRLENYFEAVECWGRTKLTKAENNRLIMSQNGLHSAVYVGDTASDSKAAKTAGLPFIYAAYGFGTVQPADYDARIDDIRELPVLLGLRENEI